MRERVEPSPPLLFALLAATAAGLVLPGFIWACLDQRVWPWDQAQYGEYTLKTLAEFRLGIAPGIASLNAQLSFKAPGVTWIGVPYALLAPVFGRVEPALLFATLTWQAVTLFACGWSAYLVSRSRLVAFAVTALLGSAPLFVGMSHQYLVEPLQTMAVALCFLLALAAHRMSGEGVIVALLGVSALAMAAKTSSPLYCALPMAYACIEIVRRGSLSRMRVSPLLRLPLLGLAISGAVLVALWYALHFQVTYRNVVESTVGSFAPYYGKSAPFVTKAAYWALAFSDALVVHNASLLIAAAAGTVVAWTLLPQSHRADRKPSEGAEARHGGWVVGVAAVSLVASFVVYSLQINDDTRFLEPLLPATAVVLAWGLSRRWERLACGAVLAVALGQYAVVYSRAFGLPSLTGVLEPWLRVVDRSDARQQQLQAVVRLTCDPHLSGEVNMVGVDLPWLSHFSANFYATSAQAGRPVCLYTGLPFAETDLDRAVEWIKHAGPSYYIAVRPEGMSKPLDYLNRVSAPAFIWVASSPQWEVFGELGDVVIFRAKHHRSFSPPRATGS
jgi:hypothetical protein